MPIAGGLISSTELSSRQANNFRRKVFYQYPQSKAPLTGLLSLAEDQEEVTLNPFGWNEERYILLRGVTASANAAGPFTDTSNVDKTAAGWSAALGATVRIHVVDASVFQVRDTVQILAANGTASSKLDIYAIVLAVETDTDEYITVRLTSAVTNALNDTTNNSLGVLVTGSSSAEGERAIPRGKYKFPTEISNYTQIFRTTIGPFTANAMQTPMKFDDSGMYKKTAKDAMIDHMTKMEQATFWGQRRTVTVTNTDGESVPERETGGLHYWMKQWEKQNISNGGTFDYVPGASDITSTSVFPTAGDPTFGSDDKRVLHIDGSINRRQWNAIVEHMFIKTGNSGCQKLFFGGYGLLSVLNDYFEKAGVKTDKMNSKEETYGLEFTRWNTIHGEVLFKSHPLFNENPDMKYTGFSIDLGSLGWHDFKGRDSEIREHVEANDYDGRKDEWLGEGGIEVKFPERFMYIRSLQSITT